MRPGGARALSALVVVALSMTSDSPATAQSVAPERSPILIDTDIGTDIDDTFALGLALGSDELDLRGVTTVGDPAQTRAVMACRFLTMTGRRHTAVALGAVPQPVRPITEQHRYFNHPDALFGRTTRPETQSAVELLYARLKQQPGRVTLVALGPLTNVARLLERHSDAASLLRRIVLLETNVALDPAAASVVVASGAALVVLSEAACRGLTLDEEHVELAFSPGTSLTRQVEALYQMWDRREPPLGDAAAVALCYDESLATIERRRVAVGGGALTTGDGEANAHVVTSIDRDRFPAWYARRMASLVEPGRRPSELVERGGMPRRVHVVEDYETDIERAWWMSGKLETERAPPGSPRACRGVLTHDFDDLLMASRRMYVAVIFNPVPGPPMGARTRLGFRYWLRGTDTLRVQIYSLTNGYHRHLVVEGLEQGAWRHATVDMTQARRADGTGAALAENERIDDIQFYADPDAELIIDDIVLYEAAADGETRPFPERIVFTGFFDTGKQGAEWPGEFDIVASPGSFWKAARSVTSRESGDPWLRIGLRGERPLGVRTRVAFRYRLAGADSLRVRLVNSRTGASGETRLGSLSAGEWAETTVELTTSDLPSVDELHLLLPHGADLLVDDVLVYEPARS